MNEIQKQATELVEMAVHKASQPKPVKLWQRLNSAAEIVFGEYGFATMDEDDMAKLVNMKLANKIAAKQFGEYGLATCTEKQMAQIINRNPELVRPDLDKLVAEIEAEQAAEDDEGINPLDRH